MEGLLSMGPTPSSFDIISFVDMYLHINVKLGVSKGVVL